MTTQSIPQNRHNFIDRTGIRYGRLVAQRVCGKIGRSYSWECICDCGNTTVVAGSNLGGNTNSCGCLFTENHTKHGMHATPEYNSWAGMIQRCTNPNNPGWRNYGSRGISVCSQWTDSFENFYADMGPRPSKKHSLDRIENNGDYAPENCRWATKEEQMANTRRNRNVSYQGETLSISQWAEKLGLGGHVLGYRLNRGWSIERAFTQPVQAKRLAFRL